MQNDPLHSIVEQLRNISARVRKLEAREDYAAHEALPVEPAEGKEYATLVVAAYNSTAHGREHADYICDGVADDVQIQAALEALAVGGKVVLLEGTYNLTTYIYITHRQHLQGMGEATRLNMPGIADISTTTGATQVTISDLTIVDGEIWLDDGTEDVTIRNIRYEAVNSGKCIYHGGSFRRLKVEGCTFIGKDTKTHMIELDLDGYPDDTIDGVLISGCHFHNCEVPIYVKGDAPAVDPQAVVVGDVRCNIQHVVIQGNTFTEDSGAASYVGNSYYSVDDLCIDGNSWEGYYSPEAIAGCLNVHVTGNAYVHSKYACIYISSWSVLTRAVTVVGNSARSIAGNFIVVSTGDDLVNEPDLTGSDNLAVVTVSGNTCFSTNAAPLYVYKCNSIAITGNNFEATYEGIYLAQVWNAVISGNRLMCQEESGAANLIYLDDGGSITIVGNHLDRVSTGDGIVLTTCDHCIIADNLLTDISWNNPGAKAGIVLSEATYCLVQGNVIRAARQTNKPQYAILLQLDAHYNTFIDNDCRDGYTDAAFYQSATVTSPETNVWRDAGEGRDLNGVLLRKTGEDSPVTYPGTLAGLNAALAAAVSGDVIDLPNVTITGDVTLPDGVQLRGQGQRATMILGQLTVGNQCSVSDLVVVNYGISADPIIAIYTDNEYALLWDVGVHAVNEGAGPAYALYGVDCLSLRLYSCELEAVAVTGSGITIYGATSLYGPESSTIDAIGCTILGSSARLGGDGTENITEIVAPLVVSGADVSSPPTDAELDAAFGTAAAVGSGYRAIVNDAGGGTAVYLVVSDGTNWWYQALTKAV